jgi:peroxiredoxin
MSRFSKISMFVALVLMAASCGRTAKIEGVVADAPSSKVVVKLLDVNRYQVLDTIATDQNGRFAYKVEVENGQPEFIYLFRNDVKLASLLLSAGDNVTVTADTLGKWTVEGSEECSKLAQVEADYAAAVSAIVNAGPEAAVQEYIKYYRDRVKYVMSNPYSLTVVPVFYQSFSESLPVFGQSTDAIHFANAADSLETVYPDSKYVKALRAEAKRRQDYMELATRISTADPVDFLDIELPDLKAQKVKLSDAHKKVTIVYFWSAADAAQKMFNLDVLAPVYKEFHDKGLEIYQVSLDADKGLWAKVVKEQNLPWVNVCDSRSVTSPYVALYNVSKLPHAFIIGANGLDNLAFANADELSKIVKKAL